MKTRVPSSMAALVLRVENTVIFCWMLFHLAKTVCVGPSLHFACFAQESSWKLWGAMRFPPEILLPLPPNSLLSEEEPGEKARRPPARLGCAGCAAGHHCRAWHLACPVGFQTHLGPPGAGGPGAPCLRPAQHLGRHVPTRRPAAWSARVGEGRRGLPQRTVA